MAQERTGTNDAQDDDVATGGDKPVSPRREARKATPKKKVEKRPNIFARIALFLRQVMAELRLVVRPTRKELTTYTLVVLSFVAIMMLFVSALDYGFGKLVLLVFAGSDPTKAPGP